MTTSWKGKQQTDSRKSEKESVHQRAAQKFVQFQDNDELDNWTDLQEWKSQSAEQAQIIDNLDQLWSDMDQLDQLDQLPWPTEQECRLDTYDGEKPLPFASSRPVVAKGKRWTLGLSITAIAASVLVAVMIVLPEQAAPTLYHTEIGAHQLVTLHDGSEVLLGGKSTLRVQYSDNVRQIYLDAGEALFTVAKDKARPFIVTAGETNVVAVGTQFNINRAVEVVVVSVVEGIVNVSTEPIASYSPEIRMKAIAELAAPLSEKTPPAKATTLTQGQQIQLTQQRMVSEVKEVVSGEVMSWRDGWLIYSGDSLGSVIEDVNRYHDKQIHIIDQQLKNIPISGTVRKDEIDDWLNGLQSAFDIKVIAMDKKIVIMSNNEK
jgi:transmembrane sensor